MKFGQIQEALYNGLKVSRKEWGEKEYISYDKEFKRFLDEGCNVTTINTANLMEGTDWYIVKEEYGFRDALKYIKENKGKSMKSKDYTLRFVGSVLMTDMGKEAAVYGHMMDMKWTIE